ncbi:MAG: hypothetical protein M3017_01680, partial [Actinomycetota bacterium]|nr:hypothetical protein [Actinomycetota bacterium]
MVGLSGRSIVAPEIFSSCALTTGVSLSDGIPFLKWHHISRALLMSLVEGYARTLVTDTIKELPQSPAAPLLVATKECFDSGPTF